MPWFVVSPPQVSSPFTPRLRCCFYSVWGKQGSPGRWEDARRARNTSDLPSGHGLLPGGGCAVFAGPRREVLPRAAPEFVVYSPAAWGGLPHVRVVQVSRSAFSWEAAAALSGCGDCGISGGSVGRGVCSWETVHLLPSPPRRVLRTDSDAPRSQNVGYRSAYFWEACLVR